MFSLVILLLYIFMGLMAQWGFLARDFALTNYSNVHQPPSVHYLLGTDFFGRSVLSRAIQGVRIALVVGFLSSGLAVFLGLSMGLFSGYFGRWVDDLVVWLYTTVESIPSILLVSAFVYCFGHGLLNLSIVIGSVCWVQLCRLVRSEVIKQKQQAYVASIRTFGAGSFYIIFKHILPNVVHLAFIQFNLIFIFSVKVEVILSFLGLGLEPGTPSWGAMIDSSRTELIQGIWWQISGASAFMFFLVLGISIFSNSLQRRVKQDQWIQSLKRS